MALILPRRVDSRVTVLKETPDRVTASAGAMTGSLNMLTIGVIVEIEFSTNSNAGIAQN